MSASVRVPDDERNIELGSAVNWPLLGAAAGLGVAVLFAVVVLALAAPAAPKPEPVVAQKTVAPAPEPDIIWPANREPRPEPREAQPQPVVVAAIPKPTVPQKPKLPPKPAVVISKPVPKPAAPVVEPTPVTAQPNPVVEAIPAQSFKRYSPYGEADLRERLTKDSREVDVETDKGTTGKLLAEVAKPSKTQSADKDADKPKAKKPPILERIVKRDDLKGLPVRDVDKCQVPAKEATIMSKMSREVRNVTAAKRSSRGSDSDFNDMWRREGLLVYFLENKVKEPEWHNDLAARMLIQMLQTETEGVRRQVIKHLAATKGKNATTTLAQRAVFDLNPDVRLAAIEALKDRPRSEFRPVLVEALRYPWAPVADHAAEALVVLDDVEVASSLVALLDKPDPQAPIQNKDKKWVVPELVRVNHLGNCVLCHAPCSAKEDTIRGLVPERGQPLPVVYYESREGSFVRADVTYIKQDFSVMQSVEKPGKWPAMQRFDYLIRQRELTADEVKRLTTASKDADPTAYPQREAILWALRELTGVNIGSRSEDWKHYLDCLKKQRLLRDLSGDF